MNKETNESISYLFDSKIVLADENASSRAAISRALVEMGAKISNIFGVNTFPQAVDMINEKKPNIVISEYILGNRNGLELAILQREVSPESESLFILATNSAQENTVAEAAEEEVDAFIVKPFTGQSLKHYLKQAIKAKANPSEYQLSIRKGKEFLDSADLEEAKSIFNRSKELNPKPSLAYYYVGLVDKKEKKLSEAVTEFDAGLFYNPIHYKCLMGKFETLDEMGDTSEAYGVAKELVTYFPVNPKRLGRLLRLAVETDNLNDIGHYYETYLNLDARTPEITRTVVAALVVAGMNQIEAGDKERACEYFDWAVNSSSRNPKVLERVVLYLAEKRLYKRARDFVKRFPPDLKDSEIYAVCNFLATIPNRSLDGNLIEARTLIRKGIRHFAIHSRAYRWAKKDGKDTVAEEVMSQIQKFWPDRISELSSEN